MKLLGASLLSLLALSGVAQSHSETLTRSFTFEVKSADNALIIANINGSVEVEGYSGDAVHVVVEKTIKAKTEARLAKGREEVQLEVIDLADTLVLYIKGTCHSFGKLSKQGKNDWPANGWGYDWNGCNNRACGPEYDFSTHFRIKVPAHIHLRLSTINDGDLEVRGVSGSIHAHNINGHIRLNDVARETKATTINGDVTVTYASNPAADCRFYSLNGDINALFQRNLSADLSFNSYNGDLYTDITSIETLPANVTASAQGDGIKYKVNGNRYRIRSGGIHLDFETFNGNVYLKENNGKN